jgi:hypothetical protein
LQYKLTILFYAFTSPSFTLFLIWILVLDFLELSFCFYTDAYEIFDFEFN